VAGDHILVRLGAVAEVLAVDARMSLPQIDDAFIASST